MAQSPGTVVLTGANGGFGIATVKKLLHSPETEQYHCILTVRNAATAHHLNAILKKTPSNRKYEVMSLDLGSLSKIRTFATEINARVAEGAIPPVGALILNAAYQDANEKTLVPQNFSEDGLEAQFAINYLANFLLVLLLLRSMDKQYGRILFISSFTHDAYDEMNHFQGQWREHKYRMVYTGNTLELSKGIVYDDEGYRAGIRRYGTSKFLLVMFMHELQRRLNEQPALSNISALALDPGGMSTDLARTSPLYIKFLVKILIPIFQWIAVWFQPNGGIRPTSKSAADVMRACFDEKTFGEFPKGLYLNGSQIAESALESRDQQKAKKLWEDSVEIAGIQDGDTVLKYWH